MATQKIAIRVDASSNIGSGHVMRCLVLADALAANGHHLTFVCRALPGDLSSLIRDRGHRVTVLETKKSRADNDGKTYSTWLPVDQREDAEQTFDALSALRPDWIVVDHYALGLTWETMLRPLCSRMMAIDDLADRPHKVEVLLDQNFGRYEKDYDGYLPTTTRRLIGPKFALLAPQFRELRSSGQGDRARTKIGRLLITMGGVDKDNVTGDVLNVLKANAPSSLAHIDVVLGRNALNIENIRARLDGFGSSCQLHIDTTEMAELMAAADLAIGAGGSTSWERCCLFLPTLMVSLADNQDMAVHALSRAGAAVDLGRAPHADFAKNLAASLSAIEASDALAQISRAAGRICSGDGTERVIKHMGLGC